MRRMVVALLLAVSESVAAPVDDRLPPGALCRVGSPRFSHPPGYGRLAFSPDGKVIASWAHPGWGAHVRFWEVASGRLLGVRPGNVVAFSPDGRRVAIGQGKKVLLYPWPLEDRPTGQLDDPDLVEALAFSPDGKRLAVGGSQVRLWELATGRELWSLPPPRDRIRSVNSIAFRPDGRQLVFSRSFGGTDVHDAATGALIREHSEDGPSLFSPDGKLLVTGGLGLPCFDADGKLQPLLWGKSAYRLVYAADGRTAAVDVWSPPGLGNWSLVGIWDFAESKWRWQRRLSPGTLYSLALSPDGRVVATDDQGALRLWDAATGQELPQSRRDPMHTSPVALSPDGKVLAVAVGPDRAAGTAPQLRLYQARTGRPLPGLRGPLAAPLAQVTFSPDGRWLAARDEAGTGRVWDAGTLREVFRTDAKGGKVTHLVFSPNGQRLVWNTTGQIGGQPSRLSVRAVGGGWEPLPAPDFDSHFVQKLAFLPDGRTLVVSESNALRFLRVPGTGAAVVNLHEEPLDLSTPVAVSPDGRSLAVTTDRGRDLRLFELRSPHGRRVKFPRSPHSVSALVFLSNRLLLTGEGDGFLRVRDTATGTVLQEVSGHASAVWRLSASADRQTVVSGGPDKFTVVWDATRWHRLRAAGPADPRPAEALWTALDGSAEEAHAAVWALAGRADAVDFLSRRLTPVAAPSPEQLAALVAGLDARRFADRQRAERALVELGSLAAPALRRVLAEGSAEQQRRARAILALLEPGPTPAAFREGRAVEVLEHAGTPAARQLLRELAGGADRARLTEEARAAFDRLAGQE